MKHVQLATLAALTLLASCTSTEAQTQPAPRATDQVAVTTPAADAPARKGEVFGNAPASAQPVAAAAVMTNAANYDGKTVLLEGAVKEVCKVKGCWMTMAESGQTMRVTFENYAFFVPKDCAGRKVVVEGKFAVKETSVADLKHYLEDAGKHDEAAKVTEPKRELTLVATGVQFVEAVGAK